jgi:KEOPS complex subunit Cgi121
MELVECETDIDDLDAFVDAVDDVAERFAVTVQAFDARYVVGRAHLERAVELADRAIDRDEAIARDRGMEILLYAAGRRQINRALAMGVSEGGVPAVILVDSPVEETGAERQAADAVRELSAVTPAETLGAYDTETVRDFFDITAAELDAADGDLSALVGERVALLTVEK